MTQALDICIRGDGIVGQSLALVLARDRLRVGLVTHPEPSAGSDVRAYALNAASRGLLESLACWPEPDRATQVLSMQVQGDAGGCVSFEAEAMSTPALTWIVDVPALDSLLKQALRFQPLVTRLEAPRAAPLQVLCEGRSGSSLREFGIENEGGAYPQHAIAARLECEQPHRQIARQWFEAGHILAALPLDGPDGRRVAVVWSLPMDEVGPWLAADAADFGERLTALARGELGRLTLCSERAAWPLRNTQARHWVGRHAGQAWALAGDAAHSVHPLAGQGLNLGLADAAALADVLRQREYWRLPDDLRLLRRYERRRKAALLPVSLTMDALQQLFSREGESWRSLRNWGMNRFETSGPLKRWVAHRAMGQAARVEP